MLEKIGLPAKPATRGSNWVVDASHCQGCSSQFTFINRKHHCRRCGGLFCNSCTQQKMVLRGQGDSPVRICEPCKKLEEAARFEMRHGHKNRAGRAGSKLESTKEDDIIKQILGSDKNESVSSRELSTTYMDSRLQRDATSASCSNIQEVTTADVEEETPGNLSVAESSPEELRQQALDEKKKYRILKGDGKSEEALRAFKRGKELERQAAALELLLRKNRKRALSLSSTNEIQINNESSNSGRKSKISPEKNKEKDNLASELRQLGWSDKDLHDSDTKPATINLEGELSTLLREVSEKSNTEAGSRGIDKSQVLALKKKALMLKREGKLGEAKEELKKAKVLEKKLEEEEFLAEAEDSDDELSALMHSIDNDKQDTFSVAYTQDTGFDLSPLLCNPDDLGVDSNFEVTDEDMDDPEMDAALKMLGWTDEANNFEGIEPQFVPIDRQILPSEIQCLKREARNQKMAGNNAEALELLRKTTALEKDLNNYVTQGNDSVSHNPAILRKVSAVQSAEKASNPNLAPKSRLMVQKELLDLKKRALAWRREGRLDEAGEELKKGKVLEQQLEEMDNASNTKALQVNVSNRNTDSNTITDLGDVREDVTDQDMNDATYLSLLSNFGWNDEDDNTVEIPSKPTKQAASSLPIGPSRRSKSEIQRELLGMKRKALAFRRQGDNDGAEEVLEMAKALEAQLEEMELPKRVTQSEIINPVESEIISSSHKLAVEGDEISKTLQEKFPERIASISALSDHVVVEDMGSNEKITYEKGEETVLRNKKNDQSTIRQEILILKRKAVALKREGKMEKAKEELKKAKLLEKSLEDENALPVINSGQGSSSTGNITKELASSNLCSKPLSSRDRFKLQQESLTHKRLALKLRREGRTVEAEAEFELAKALETQLENLGSGDSVKSSASGANAVVDFGIEDFLDPQLLSALKAIGFDDASTVNQGHEEPEPTKSVANNGENSGQERMKLEEQIRSEKTKAVNLKRTGRQTEALDALRRAKALEKR